MSQIGTLVTGAGIVTPIPGLSYVDQYIVLGDVDTAIPVTGLQVEIAGETTINIVASTPLVSAFSKFMSQFCATVVANVIKIATGRIYAPSTLRFTNGGATTPGIFNFGDEGNGKPIRAISVGVNSQSNQVFNKFSALMITPSANAGNIDFQFKDGTQVTMSIAEVDALFAIKNPTQADGRLDAVVSTIDNREGKIEWVRVNATTALTVLVIKLSDQDFQELKAGL
jgi:hypothetical protein